MLGLALCEKGKVIRSEFFHIDYLKEGFRILKPYGSLFICEPKKKAESRMENLKKEIEDCGFKIIDIKPSSQFIYFNAVKV